MIKRIYTIFLSALILATTLSCRKEEPNKPGLPHSDEYGNKVFLYYTIGCNDLSYEYSDDLEDLKKGYLPPNRDIDNVLLAFATRLSDKRPALVRLYRDDYNNCISDTLHVYNEGVTSASEQTLRKVLEDIREIFPDKEYGMLISSHGSGWIPQNYYSNDEALIYANGEYDDYLWSNRNASLTSIGIDKIKGTTYELNIDKLAEGIPYKLEYLFFDACFMGSIEVAYELKDKCSHIGFSPTEILADGFDYNNLVKSLFLTGDHYLEKVCQDYMDHYMQKNGTYRSATICLINNEKIDDLAALCKELNTKYRKEFETIDRSLIQRYHRAQRYYHYHWFYDLKDIYSVAGASQNELWQLDEELNKTIMYKNATRKFIDLEIKQFSGLSMYLPYSQWPQLNEYYKKLAWNNATQLVN